MLPQLGKCKGAARAGSYIKHQIQVKQKRITKEIKWRSIVRIQKDGSGKRAKQHPCPPCRHHPLWWWSWTCVRGGSWFANGALESNLLWVAPVDRLAQRRTRGKNMRNSEPGMDTRRAKTTLIALQPNSPWGCTGCYIPHLTVRLFYSHQYIGHTASLCEKAPSTRSCLSGWESWRFPGCWAQQILSGD